MKKHLYITLIVILAAVLRLYALDKFPAGLNADEAAIGYNAYSLLETGRDEHGASWPLVFQSFDDYKPPLYFYLVLPFVKVLGLNIWSVRLPSAILGIASVYLIYLLAKSLFNPRVCIGILSALLLAISPWHLHFSRGGWEANAATFFVLLGVWSFIKAIKKPVLFYLASLSLVASLYAYHSIRIVAPLLALFLLYLYRHRIRFSKHFIISLLLALVLSLPIASQMLGSAGTSRFSGVSVFSDQGPLWEALERRRQSAHPNSIQTRLIHNKYLTYSKRLINNYLSHYSPRFLFVTGDTIQRNKVPEIGQSYLLLAPFYFLGLLYLLRLDTQAKKFVLFWYLVAPVAAALTFQSPHALRAQNMVIPLTLITALGVSGFSSIFKKHKAVLIVSIFVTLSLLSYSLAHYLHQYYVHYPKENPFAWQYGFDQVAKYLEKNADQYDSIIISNRYDQPYIIMAFYLQYPPDKFQQEIKLVPRDKFGFSTVNAFGKLKFKEINWEQDSQTPSSLIITTTESVPDDIKPIFQVQFLNQEPAFNFYQTAHI